MNANRIHAEEAPDVSTTTARPVSRTIDGVRFERDVDGIYRATLPTGRAIWVWEAGIPGDPTWHYGDIIRGEDRNRGTRGRREDAMRDVIAWAAAEEDKRQAAGASTQVVRAALEGAKPEIAAEYGRIVRGMIDRMIRDVGETLKGVHNHWRWAKVYREELSNLIGHDRTTRIAAIDEAAVATHGAIYADECVKAWAAKIEAKLAGLDRAQVERLAGASFRITGERAGRRVEIMQDRIVNTTARGTPYNQFPARIRLDGKPISEAAYKREVGA